MGNLATLESLMFRQLEIKREMASLKDEKTANNLKILNILKESNMNYYTAKFDEHHELKVEIKENNKKRFEKERLATDLGATSMSAATRKDFLINMAEQGKLTLKKFNQYFYFENETSLSIKKVKLKKAKSRA